MEKVNLRKEYELVYDCERSRSEDFHAMRLHCNFKFLQIYYMIHLKNKKKIPPSIWKIIEKYYKSHSLNFSKRPSLNYFRRPISEISWAQNIGAALISKISFEFNNTHIFEYIYDPSTNTYDFS
jgi:hypothetical protein